MNQQLSKAQGDEVPTLQNQAIAKQGEIKILTEQKAIVETLYYDFKSKIGIFTGDHATQMKRLSNQCIDEVTALALKVQQCIQVREPMPTSETPRTFDDYY